MDIPAAAVGRMMVREFDHKLTLDQLDETFQAYIETAKTILTTQGEVRGIVFIFGEGPSPDDGKNTFLELSLCMDEFVTDDFSKEMFMGLLQATTRSVNAYAMIHVAEAWQATYSKVGGETAAEAVARIEAEHQKVGGVEHMPGRVEILQANLETQAVSKTFRMEILRDPEGNPLLGKEEMCPGPIAGRFTGMIPRTLN